MEFRVVCDLALASGERIEAAGVDRTGAPLLGVARGDRLEVRRFADDRWSALVEVPGGLERPHLDLLGNDVLVVDTRCVREPDGHITPNGVVYDLRGTVLDRLALGDGVESIGTTESGEIWVSYRDEGTMGDFGAYGWGRINPRTWIDPIGRSGLARFDRAGRRLAELEPPAIDCFALNVDGEAAWACYHPGFPLVRVDAAGRRAWETGELGADALAVSGERVALYVGYGLRAHTCRLGRLGERSVEGLEAETATLEDRSPVADVHEVLGRGRSLHAVGPRRWYRFDL